MLRTYRKLLTMLTPGERKRFWIVTSITFVLTLFEAASVLSILPFLQLLAEPELITTNARLARVYDWFGFTDTRDFSIATGIAVFIITVLGLMMKIFTIWLTTRFALMRTYSFSARLMTGYLNQPYEWFLSRHSADLSNTILAEVTRVVWEGLLPAMRLIPDIFTVIMLVSLLCILEPAIALTGAGLLGGIYAIIYLSVRRYLGRLGAIRLSANQTRFHVVQEATGGLKELKIMGLERGFLNRFREASLRLANVQTRGQVISTTPRYALEAVAFGGMIILILTLLSGDGDLQSIIPTLGLIAAIGLRLIPALQQVYQRLSILRQSEASLDKVYADMIEVKGALSGNDTDTPLPGLSGALELDAVTYDYPSGSNSALANLVLRIEANTTIGVVGGTGAGKTTLIDIILGLLVPQSGTLRADGIPITDENRGAWQRTLGYVPQTIFLSDGTVAENIAFGIPREEIDMTMVETAARVAALHDFVTSELPEAYDTPVGERGVRLSGGQRQRIGIARALYRDPAVLILDEATSALDNVTERAVMEAVHNIAGEKTIIMIAHRLSTVRECDRIYLLKGGKVAASGRYDDLLKDSAEFRAMAGATDSA